MITGYRPRHVPGAPCEDWRCGRKWDWGAQERLYGRSPAPAARMAADIEIAQAARMRPIVDVAADLGLGADDLLLRGEHVAKGRLGAGAAAPQGPPGEPRRLGGTDPTR